MDAAAVELVICAQSSKVTLPDELVAVNDLPWFETSPREPPVALRSNVKFAKAEETIRWAAQKPTARTLQVLVVDFILSIGVLVLRC